MATGIYSLQGGSGQQSLVPVQLHLYAGLKVNILQINRHSVLQDTVSMSDAGALDAAAIGERSAGQGCPLIGIQCEILPSLLVAIDNQDSFVGNNIIFGSPGGQCPVCVSSLGSDAAGQEIMSAGIYSLQGSRGQQGLTTVQLHLYAGLKVNILQINRHSVLQDTVIMSDADALDAAGERSAGQGCPLIGIKREGLRILLVAIDNQDSPVGDNIVLGSPGGQCPVLVSSLGSDAAGQVRIRTSSQLISIQRSRGQQSLAAVQLHLYAGFEGNVFQFNGNSIFQDSVIMSDDGALDAAVAICRCDSGQGADHDQNQHHCK